MNPKTRNSLFIIFSLIALGFAGYRMFAKTNGKLVIPKSIEGHGVCLACQADVMFQQALGNPGPAKCSACGEEAVYAWKFCSECDYRFVPSLEQRPEGYWAPTPFPVCPHCGCKSVSQYNPELLDQVPRGDANLPKWPPE